MHYQPAVFEIIEQRRFYDEGLRLLQTINPNLTLLTPQSFSIHDSRLDPLQKIV